MFPRCVYLLLAEGAFVRLFPGVDLPVSVEAAGVSQHLATLLTLDHGLPSGADLPCLDGTIRMPLSSL